MLYMIFKIVKIKVIIFKNLIYICANNVKKITMSSKHIWLIKNVSISVTHIYLKIHVNDDLWLVDSVKKIVKISKTG